LPPRCVVVVVEVSPAARLASSGTQNTGTHMSDSTASPTQRCSQLTCASHWHCHDSLSLSLLRRASESLHSS
jgi:hypothetical protein